MEADDRRGAGDRAVISSVVVHSGFVPSCLDKMTAAQAEGLTVGFGEESVTCPDCLRLWREQGTPKYAVRIGETPAEFLKRTWRT